MDSLNLKEENSYLSSSILSNDNIGLIRINNSLGQNRLVEEFEKELKKMDATKAIIIDLRNTIDGGNTSVAIPIMGKFISSKKPYQLYENKGKKYLGYIKPNKPTNEKPLYILVNRWTGSMGEGIAIGLNSMERATIVGTEMARLAGGIKSIDFQHHDYGFQISFEKIFDTDNNLREEFIPKEYVKQTQLIEDEMLNYTILKINRK